MVEKGRLREKLLQWEKLLTGYSLPAWDAFPTLPLYMDQVILLLNQYLALLPDQTEQKQVTPAMINNYVKLKIIPPPVRKRYNRKHLAYLIIVCVCKRNLNINDIKKLIPFSLTEDAVKCFYEDFTSAFSNIQQYFCQEVRKAAAPVFSEENEQVTHLLFRTAVTANLATLLTEEILRLDGDNSRS